jgi:hypothetical protein
MMANRANDNPKDPAQMSLGLVRDTCKKWSQGGRARGPNVIRARREHGSGILRLIGLRGRCRCSQVRQCK